MIEADTLLTLSEVVAKVGIGKMTIYRRMRKDQFPQPLQVGVRAVRWRMTDIVEWQNGLTKGVRGK